MRFVEVFVEYLGAGDTPGWPHPDGRRWDVIRDDGEWMVYAGRVAAVVTPGSTVRRKVQSAALFEG